MEAKLNQENCEWLSGENVEKKPLRLRREIFRLELEFN